MSGTLMKTLHETTRVSRHDVHGRAGLSPGCVTEVGGSGSTPVTRTRWGTAQRLRRAATRPKTSRVKADGGRHYGTVLVDIETRRPVDLSPDREASPLAAWPAQRPIAEVVCRDRAPFFAEAAAGAPQAVQVADQWHLCHNLSEATERTVAQHCRCTRVLVPEAPEPEPSTWLWESPPDRVCDVGLS